ncbi:g10682 [Coccomyxa elongata]
MYTSSASKGTSKASWQSDKKAQIASAQTHAERALAELAAVREREQALLQRRVETLERAFREGVADLEHRFLLQAEQLKRELLSKIAETKTGCEATIEAKAQQLTSALEAADRCPCATASSKWEDNEDEWHAVPAKRVTVNDPATAKKSPIATKSSLLRQRTVSGTWNQDTNSDRSPRSTLHQAPGYKPCNCRRADRIPSTLRTIRASDLIDSDDDDF